MHLVAGRALMHRSSMRFRSRGFGLVSLLSIVLSSGGCGPHSGGPGDLPDGVPDDVAAALAALPDAEVLALGKDSLPTFVHGMLGKGPPRLDAGKADEALAPAMDPITPVFRLQMPEIRVVAVWRDDAGYAHARYQQMHEGLEVVGGDLSVHMNPRGEIYAVHGTARGAIDVDLVPAITDQQALAVLAAETGARPADLEVPELVIKESTVDQGMHLAYRIPGVGPRGVPFTGYVDAHDGAVLSVEEAHVPILERAIYDAGGHEVRPGREVRGEGDGPVGDADVDAAFDNFGETWHCYRDLFGRDSVDGDGLPLMATVHWGDHYANAYWDGTNDAMVFGDGDGEEIGPLARASDVVTHELTHGVVEFTAGLVYQDEPGALNEGYADIMAAVCDAHLKGASDEATYLVGEDAYTPDTPGDAIRYMSDPERDGYSVGWWPNRVNDWWDNGGVHTNSGIANLAFYLLAEGGQNPRHPETARVPGIGVERAGAIFYRALAQYLTPQADFAAARAATVRAALDLEGSDTAAIVNLAWDAVGVPSPDTPKGPEVPVEACDNGVDDDGDGLTDCGDTSCSMRGSCATPWVGEQGPLKVTEVMIDPIGRKEPAGEWFEVYNWTKEPVDLVGFTIGSVGGVGHRIGRSVVVAPGDFAVLAYAADSSLGFVPDYVYGPSSVRLANQRDILSLYDRAGHLVVVIERRQLHEVPARVHAIGHAQTPVEKVCIVDVQVEERPAAPFRVVIEPR